MKEFFWKRPHPFIFNTASVVLPGVLTFILLFILAPFNFSDLPLLNRLLQALMSTAIASGSIALSVWAARSAFPDWSKPSSWTIGKEISLFLWVVFMIATIHFALYLVLYSDEAPLKLFQQVVLYTLAISLFPIIGLVFFEQYNHRTMQLKRAIELNKVIRTFHARQDSDAQESSSEKDLTWFFNENGKPACQLDPKRIQYLKADGNYIEIYCLDENSSLKRQLVRNSLSKAEKTLPHSFFWRVHRSYIANLNHIEKVIGNARDLELVMEKSGERLPVSRTKAKSLLKEITNLSHLSQIAPNRPK